MPSRPPVQPITPVHEAREEQTPWLEAWLGRLIRRRGILAIVVAAIVVVASTASVKLRIQNDLEAFFVAGDPVMVAWHEFRARFGTDEVVLLTLTGTDSIHTPERRAALQTLTRSLEAIADVDRVQSLSNVAVVVPTGVPTGNDTTGADDGGFEIRPVGDDSEARLHEARARHGLLERLASADDRTQLIWLWLKADATTDVGRSRAIAAINVATEPLRERFTVRTVGGGVVWEALNALTVRDGAVFISLASVVLLLGLLVVTRRLLWGAVAVVAVSCANTVVFALMALLDVPLNAITVCLPSLVMALGVLDLLHLITTVDDLPDDVTSAHDPRVARALARVVVPGLFNIVTTAVGLLALLTASTAVTRQLGGFAAVGVVGAWVFCLALTMVALPRALHPRRRRHRPTERGEPWSGRIAIVSLAHRGKVLVAAALFAGVSVAGMARLVTDTDTLGFLPASHPVVQDTRAVEGSVGPFIPLEVDLAWSTPGAWRTGAVVDGLRRASDGLRLVRGLGPAGNVSLGRPVSVVDVLAESDVALGTVGTVGTVGAVGAVGTVDNNRVEAGLALIAAMAPTLTDGLVSVDDRHLRVTVPVTLTTSRGFLAAAVVVTDTLEQSMAGTGVTVSLTGYLPLYARIVHALVDDQLVSFGVAFVGVFLLLGVFLRSWRLLLVAAVPNLLPIAGVLGVMGFCGVALDVATITIAATILGVVVDDTVHTLHDVRTRLAWLPPTDDTPARAVDDAILQASRTVGRANLAGNGLLALGFLVLVAASARSLVLVGALSATAVLLALVADLVVLPALASLVLRAPSARHRNQA